MEHPTASYSKDMATFKTAEMFEVFFPLVINTPGSFGRPLDQTEFVRCPARCHTAAGVFIS